MNCISFVRFICYNSHDFSRNIAFWNVSESSNNSFHYEQYTHFNPDCCWICLNSRYGYSRVMSGGGSSSRSNQFGPRQQSDRTWGRRPLVCACMYFVSMMWIIVISACNNLYCVSGGFFRFCVLLPACRTRVSAILQPICYLFYLFGGTTFKSVLSLQSNCRTAAAARVTKAAFYDWYVLLCHADNYKVALLWIVRVLWNGVSSAVASTKSSVLELPASGAPKSLNDSV